MAFTRYWFFLAAARAQHHSYSCVRQSEASNPTMTNRSPRFKFRGPSLLKTRWMLQWRRRSLGLAQNPAFKFLDAALLRLSRLPLAADNFHHSKQAHDSIKCVVSLGESFADCASQRWVEFYTSGVRPCQQVAGCLSPDFLFAFARQPGEKPVVALRRIRLSYYYLARLEKFVKRAVEWPQQSVIPTIQSWSNYIPPPDNRSFADLIWTERPEQWACGSPTRLLFLAFASKVVDAIQPQCPEQVRLPTSPWYERIEGTTN